MLSVTPIIILKQTQYLPQLTLFQNDTFYEFTQFLEVFQISLLESGLSGLHLYAYLLFLDYTTHPSKVLRLGLCIGCLFGF